MSNTRSCARVQLWRKREVLLFSHLNCILIDPLRRNPYITISTLALNSQRNSNTQNNIGAWQIQHTAEREKLRTNKQTWKLLEKKLLKSFRVTQERAMARHEHGTKKNMQYVGHKLLNREYFLQLWISHSLSVPVYVHTRNSVSGLFSLSLGHVARKQCSECLQYIFTYHWATCRQRSIVVRWKLNKYSSHWHWGG